MRGKRWASLRSTAAYEKPEFAPCNLCLTRQLNQRQSKLARFKSLSLMPKVIPDILKEHILPFDWDVRQIWQHEAEVINVPIAEFTYLLALPLWSSVPGKGMLFDTCPIDVIRDPHTSVYQAQRLQAAELCYPIEILLVRNRRWILDGVHRIAKAHMLGMQNIAIRLHHESIIPSIKIG